MENKYGLCSECATPLIAVHFREKEYQVTREGFQYQTGRTRMAVDYLMCPDCLRKYCVDDSFDGPWR